MWTGLAAVAAVTAGIGLSHSAAGQTSPVVRFVTGTVFALPDERVDMVVEAVDVEDLAGFQVTVRWDPRILEYIDVEVLEDFMTASGRTIDFTPPIVSDTEVTLAAYTLPPSGVAVPGASGSGELLRVGFRALRAGHTDVELHEVLLVNTLNDPIAADVESGQVVVVGPDGAEGKVYMPFGER